MPQTAPRTPPRLSLPFVYRILFQIARFRGYCLISHRVLTLYVLLFVSIHIHYPLSTSLAESPSLYTREKRGLSISSKNRGNKARLTNRQVLSIIVDQPIDSPPDTSPLFCPRQALQ